MRTDHSTRAGKVIVALALAGVGVVSWMCMDAPEIHGMLWAARLGAPIGTLITLLWAVYQSPTRTLQDGLRALRPGVTTTCPFCTSPIEPRFGAQCGGCGVKQTAVPLTTL